MSKTATDTRITYMKRNVGDHIDSCGEVNMTTLAEDCANALFDAAATDKEFEAAYEVAQWYEKNQAKHHTQHR